MPSIHIPDDVFADYVIAAGGDATEAKSQMQDVVAEHAPEEAEA